MKADGRNEDDVVNMGGSGVNIVEGYPKMNNKLEDLKRQKYENKTTNVGASSVRIGGESDVISAMDVGDGYEDDTIFEEDTRCAKVNNVGATRACSDNVIVTNMNICSTTLARTVRDSVQSMTEPGLSRSRSKLQGQRAGEQSSSARCSPLRGTRRPSTSTRTTR